MSSKKVFNGLLHVPETLVKHRFKAIFYPDASGAVVLARIQEFSTPVFTDRGWVPEDDSSRSCYPLPMLSNDPHNIERATRRARKLAADLVGCNPELHWFVTLTFSPDCVKDKGDFSECYKLLKVFLSNAVERRGLAYLGTVERTKAGDIHFHFLFNDGMRYTLSNNPHTNKPVELNGMTVYNLPGWRWGFTTAQNLDDEGGDRDRAAAYILKYITKDRPTDAGGRYIYKGGSLREPLAVCGDSLSDFDIDPATAPLFEKEIDGTALVYREYSFGKPKK